MDNILNQWTDFIKVLVPNIWFFLAYVLVTYAFVFTMWLRLVVQHDSYCVSTDDKVMISVFSVLITLILLVFVALAPVLAPLVAVVVAIILVAWGICALIG